MMELPNLIHELEKRKKDGAPIKDLENDIIRELRAWYESPTPSQAFVRHIKWINTLSAVPGDLKNSTLTPADFRAIADALEKARSA